MNGWLVVLPIVCLPGCRGQAANVRTTRFAHQTESVNSVHPLEVEGPFWSPDGTRVATTFSVQGRQGEVSQLWVIRYPSESSPVHYPVVEWQSAALRGVRPQWLPGKDNRLVFTVPQGDGFAVVRLGHAARGAHALATGSFITDNLPVNSPQAWLSPHRVLATSLRSDGGMNLNSLDIYTGVSARIANHINGWRIPCASRDGEYIAYADYTNRMRVDRLLAGNWTLMPVGMPISARAMFRWAGSSRTLVVLDPHRDHTDLMTIQFPAGLVLRKAKVPYDVTDMALSPEGLVAMVCHPRVGPISLMVYSSLSGRSLGGTSNRIMNPGAPAWAPTGGRLAFFGTFRDNRKQCIFEAPSAWLVGGKWLGFVIIPLR